MELAPDLRRGCAITSKLGELYGFDSAGQGAAARGKEPLRGQGAAARARSRCAGKEPLRGQGAIAGAGGSVVRAILSAACDDAARRIAVFAAGFV